LLHVDTKSFFDDSERRLAPDARSVLIFANPVLPHSEGEITVECGDPHSHPQIRMNYYSDPHDMKVMIAVLRRAFDIAAHWPGQRLGPWLAPPALSRKHMFGDGKAPTDAMLEDLALHFSITVFHLTGTCRMGNVVDPRLRVMNVQRLRVADASIMPNLVSGNPNAACVMIGEKAAEMIAGDHDIRLAEMVGEPPRVGATGS
jgi:choline dehydrogenase